ncbi:hypothetical protein GCM10010331_49740 [Streptomyces xanthochromogenes]|uniref:hypothetical protein n=1 Tax=Streptomyces xanthochromogenes TaxID=67384 RepID=UPI0016764E34|nr:hypothetical protein [Streptomyces xanthochromogenes]GHB55918.1 hypothetical protein GCM10010331_49740 [Streptomyces xanthochromogenes]
MTTATKPLPPHHDKLTCYTNYHCRRPECVDRYNRYNRSRLHSQAAGTWEGLVDARPVRDHVIALLAAGATPHGVAIQARVSDKAVRDLLPPPPSGRRYPAKYRVAKATADKILAVQAEDIAAPLIDATGTIRRIQALVADGWPLNCLAEQVGLYPKYIYELLRRTQAGESSHVARSTARQAADLFEELRTQKPARLGVNRRTATRARHYAADRNWAPTAYWNHYLDAIDDPDFIPEYKKPRAQTIAEDAAWIMRTSGLDKEQIAVRLGISRDYLQQVLTAHRVEVAA